MSCFKSLSEAAFCSWDASSVWSASRTGNQVLGEGGQRDKSIKVSLTGCRPVEGFNTPYSGLLLMHSKYVCTIVFRTTTRQQRSRTARCNLNVFLPPSCPQKAFRVGQS